MSRIAVRTDGELQWVLTDHLSSASVSASVDGTLVSEVKHRKAPLRSSRVYNLIL
jgi:hypothetical protein